MLEAVVIICVIAIAVACFIGLSSSDSTPSYTPSYEPPRKKALCCRKCGSESVAWAHRNKDGGPDLRYSTNYLVCKECKHAERYKN